MVSRRGFVAHLALLAVAPRAAAAQSIDRVRLIGVLGPSAATSDAPQVLPEVLASLGYVVGRNIAFEWRWAEGRTDRLTSLAQELVAREVDVIVSLANDATAAAKRATTVIPIVMVGVSLPEEIGFVATLARPGGNLTGMAYNPPEVAGKLVEVVKTAIPTLARLAVVWNPNTPGIAKYVPHLEQTARHLGINVVYVEVPRASEMDAAFSALGRLRPQAVYLVNDPVIQSRQHDVVTFMLKRKIPAIYTSRPYVDAGGLMYYGPSRREMWERSASYVDRILRGGKPAELPVEQPAKFELAINMKTAKALGLTIPPSLLLRAEHVVE